MGGGGGGGGFAGTGIGGDIGKALTFASPAGMIAQSTGMFNNTPVWGKQGGMSPVFTTSGDQQAMAHKYSEAIDKYGGYSRPGLQSLMAAGPYNIDPSSNVNPWATNQFFRQNVYQPAMDQFQGVTLPGIREAMGKNYWSTARRAQEQNAALQNDKNLMQQLANLQYQDEQARRQIADTTQARRIQENAREQSQRMNILQLLDPLLQQHFAPIATAHTVDQMQNPYQPGLMDRLGQIIGIAGSGAQTAGNIGKLAAMV